MYARLCMCGVYVYKSGVIICGVCVCERVCMCDVYVCESGVYAWCVSM